MQSVHPLHLSGERNFNSVFAARLTTLLSERLPQSGGTGGASSLAPDSVGR